MFDIRVDIVYNQLKRVRENTPKAAMKRTHQAALKVRDLAVDNAPKLTGSGAASIYVSSPVASTYSQAASRARSLKPNVRIVDEERPDDDKTAVIGVAARHMFFVHEGTSRMAARPFLAQAAESAGRIWENSIANIEVDLLG